MKITYIKNKELLMMCLIFEIEILDEKNEKIEMSDYFSVSLYIH